MNKRELLVMTEEKPTAEDIEKILEPHEKRMRAWRLIRSTPVSQIDWDWNPRPTDKEEQELMASYRYASEPQGRCDFDTPFIRPEFSYFETEWKLRNGHTRYAPPCFIGLDGKWHGAEIRQYGYLPLTEWIACFYEKYICGHENCWVTAIVCAIRNTVVRPSADVRMP